jgi:hypothetical protein
MINSFVCNTAPFQPTIQDGEALTATSIKVKWLKPRFASLFVEICQ